MTVARFSLTRYLSVWALLNEWLTRPEIPVRSTRSRRAAGFFGIALVWASLLKMTAAMAFATPAAGSFGFDVYDIVVNQILGGPIGFVGGVALIVWGGAQVIKNWVITVLAIVAGTIIIRADTLVTSLGATI